MDIDIAANRASEKWTRREKMGRVLWATFSPLFKFSPRIFWGWRRWLLRMFGATVGHSVHIYPSVHITIPWNLTVGENSAIGDRAIIYALGSITIGQRATISQGAHLCAGTHDWKLSSRPLIKASINIGDDTWICADSFIGPGVTIGNQAIVGARAVAMRNVVPGVIVVGNPCKVLKKI